MKFTKLVVPISEMQLFVHQIDFQRPISKISNVNQILEDLPRLPSLTNQLVEKVFEKVPQNYTQGSFTGQLYTKPVMESFVGVPGIVLQDFRTIFDNEEMQPCGLHINYFDNDPSLWVAAIIQNTLDNPQELVLVGRSDIISHLRDKIEADKTKEIEEIEGNQIQDKFLGYLRSKELEDSVQNIFKTNGEVNTSTIATVTPHLIDSTNKALIDETTKLEELKKRLEPLNTSLSENIQKLTSELKSSTTDKIEKDLFGESIDIVSNQYKYEIEELEEDGIDDYRSPSFSDLKEKTTLVENLRQAAIQLTVSRLNSAKTINIDMNPDLNILKSALMTEAWEDLKIEFKRLLLNLGDASSSEEVVSCLKTNLEELEKINEASFLEKIKLMRLEKIREISINRLNFLFLKASKLIMDKVSEPIRNKISQAIRDKINKLTNIEDIIKYFKEMPPIEALVEQAQKEQDNEGSFKLSFKLILAVICLIVLIAGIAAPWVPILASALAAVGSIVLLQIVAIAIGGLGFAILFKDQIFSFWTMVKESINSVFNKSEIQRPHTAPTVEKQKEGSHHSPYTCPELENRSTLDVIPALPTAHLDEKQAKSDDSPNNDSPSGPSKGP